MCIYKYPKYDRGALILPTKFRCTLYDNRAGTNREYVQEWYNSTHYIALYHASSSVHTISYHVVSYLYTVFASLDLDPAACQLPFYFLLSSAV